MRRMRFLCGLFSLLIGASLIAPQIVPAQQPAPDNIIQIRKITGAKVSTPQYQLLKGQVMARTLDWFQINVSYETYLDFLDELTFTYYVAVKGKLKPSLFKGEVTYINVAKGKHMSDIYLHPSTVTRYGSPERIAVVVSSQGRILAMDSYPAATPRWWEQFPVPPVDGLLLNRMQTPFAMINFDDYEAVKPLAR